MSPALVEGNLSSVGQIHLTQPQNSDLEFGQAEPEPVKS